MNSRLTIQDLAGLLADYTGKDPASIERFLKEFVAVVTEGVLADKLVKIKGLGTFKIIAVEKRESIHVKTSERFLIPGHYKFSFLPDKELKELVNKPFSFFETIEVGESVDFSDLDISDDDADEKDTEDESVEELMLEEQRLPQLEPQAEPDPEPESEELPQELSEVLPEELPEELPDELSVAEAIESSAEVTGTVEEEVPEVIPEAAAPEAPRKRRRSRTRKKISKQTFILAACLFILIAINGIIYLNKGLFQSGNEAIPAVYDSSLALTSDTLAGATKQPDSLRQAADSLATVQQATSSGKPQVAPPPAVIAKVKIEPGSRLTVIALEYYGSKVFWVYLYEYNKTIIKNPNNVPIGTVIEVPSPELYNINVRDKVSIEKAAVRQTEILNGQL